MVFARECFRPHVTQECRVLPGSRDLSESQKGDLRMSFIASQARFAFLKNILLAAAVLCFVMLPASGNAKGVSTETDHDIGLKTYMYAYPMVLLDTTRTQGGYSDNKLYHSRTFADPTETTVIRPNVDTLYTTAYLNLSSGPIVLTVPDMGDRYYMIQLMDAWTDTFADMGTRTSGNAKQKFMIVPPHWTGTIPSDNVNIIKAPTHRVWLLGRIYSDGSAADLEIVNQLQDKMKLTRSASNAPMSAGLAEADEEDAATDITNAGTGLTPPQIVAQMDAKTFFTTFAKIMKKNKPHAEDWPMRALMNKIGIYPGSPFKFSSLSAETQSALSTAVTDAQKIILKNIASIQPGTIVNTWKFNTLFLGSYGAAYPYRAFIAYYGLGANLPDDAIYPGATISMDGSAHTYTIHFDSGQLPPVNAFWSITMYTSSGYLYENSINRYAIRSSDSLVTNADGSVDIYIQNQAPGDSSLQANWLPCPAASFTMSLRMYWPSTEVLYGTSSWKMPAIVAQ